MALRFYGNKINSCNLTNSPESQYKELHQAFNDASWENTASLDCIQEQDVDKADYFKDFEFHNVEGWLSYIVGETATGEKNGNDFVEISFRNVEHPCIKGRYYRFDNNYWITHYTNRYNGVNKYVGARRCNNVIRMVDPENGSIYSIPCVIDYLLSSTSNKIDSSIITPGAHAVVKVQGNKNTYKLFVNNKRVVFGKTVFKMTTPQDTILDDYKSEHPSLMTLNLYLDEIHAKDDIENQLADNGDYNYAIEINGKDMALKQGDKGALSAFVTLNGEEVERQIVWTSDNKAVQIDAKGGYNIVGKVGSKATIRATLEGNDKVFDEITIIISDEATSKPDIVLAPEFSKVREGETVKADFTVVYNGVEYKPDESSISLSSDSIVTENEFLSISKVDNNYRFTCNKIAKEPVTLYLKAKNTVPAFEAEEIKEIKLVNMFE